MDQSLPVIIDTDCGVDDAVALWWALASPRLDIVAITTVWGNVGVAGAAGNVGRILDAVGRHDVALALGGDEPFAPAPELRVADFIHGTDGLGNTFRPEPSKRPGDETAILLLRRLVDERPGEITVITLGPLSNVAAVIDEDPTWPRRVKDLYVMGGAVAVQGNALPQGEANIAHDPVAADVVARAAWPHPPMLVGLDVTLAATFTPAIFELLAEQRTPAAAFLDAPMRFYRTFGATFSPTGECPCHDLLTVIAAAQPDICDAPVLPFAVQATPGPAWGTTIVDRRVPFFAAAGGDSEQPAHDDGFRPWRIALGVDVDRFRLEMIELFGGEMVGAES